MTLWQRFLRYLIVWGILFLVLCVISVVRYRSELGEILSNTFMSYLSLIITVGIVIGAIVFLFRALFR